MSPKPEPAWLRDYKAVMAEPLLLPDHRLPKFGAIQSGRCRSCLLAPAMTGTLCDYCQMLADAKSAIEGAKFSAAHRPAARTRSPEYRIMCGLLAAIVVAGLIGMLLSVLYGLGAVVSP